MLPLPRRPRAGPLNPALAVGRAKLEEAEDLDDAVAALNAQELAAVLGDRTGLERLVNLSRPAPATQPERADEPRCIGPRVGVGQFDLGPAQAASPGMMS